MKQKLIVLGHGGHAKDTVALWLAGRFDYTFESSSNFCARKFIYDALKKPLGYSSFNECYSDRRNHRATWAALIKSYNLKDPARLAREIYAENDMYVGIRSNLEFEEAKSEGLFQLAIWVDASERCELEGKDSFDIDISKADIVINNNGTEEELFDRLETLFSLS
jgi:hypothetical protein